MKAEIKGNSLILTLPLQEPKASSTGKTLIVATSGGNIETDLKIKGKNVKIGVNAYIPA